MTADAPGAPIDRWRSGLAEWAIPEEILSAAPESPWALSARTFAARADRAVRRPGPTPSHRRAAEALPEGGTVLDVGAGAGAASLPLLGRARGLIAVDGDAAMLDELRRRVPVGVELTTILGRWPDVEAAVDDADVVTCHHVAYNVPDLDVFVEKLNGKARVRVVMELTATHPRSAHSFLWPLFHGSERPARPTAADAVDVIRTAGMAPHVEEWTPDDLHMASDDVGDLVATVRRSLCLAADRDREIARALEPHLIRRDAQVGFPPRPVVTVWWDV